MRLCHEAGFAAHLTKPVDLASLEAVILEMTSIPARDRTVSVLN